MAELFVRPTDTGAGIGTALLRHVVAEAAKKLPASFRAKYPDVDWKKMAGMRDRLIHNYFGVDYYIVYDVARNKAPELTIQPDRILSREEREKADELGL